MNINSKEIRADEVVIGNSIFMEGPVYAPCIAEVTSIHKVGDNIVFGFSRSTRREKTIPRSNTVFVAIENDVGFVSRFLRAF